jgi:hypothetical protein
MAALVNVAEGPINCYDFFDLTLMVEIGLELMRFCLMMAPWLPLALRLLPLVAIFSAALLSRLLKLLF